MAQDAFSLFLYKVVPIWMVAHHRPRRRMTPWGRLPTVKWRIGAEEMTIERHESKEGS
jgi:hypothetical protein